MEETKTVKRKDLHSLKSSVAAVMGYIQLAQKKLESLDEQVAEQSCEMLSKALLAADSLNNQIRELEGIEEPLMDL